MWRERSDWLRLFFLFLFSFSLFFIFTLISISGWNSNYFMRHWSFVVWIIIENETFIYHTKFPVIILNFILFVLAQVGNGHAEEIMSHSRKSNIMCYETASSWHIWDDIRWGWKLNHNINIIFIKWTSKCNLISWRRQK